MVVIIITTIIDNYNKYLQIITIKVIDIVISITLIVIFCKIFVLYIILYRNMKIHVIEINLCKNVFIIV